MMAAIGALFILVLCLIGFCIYCVLAVPLWLITGDRILSRNDSPGRLPIGLLVVSVSYLLLVFAGYTWATRPAAVFEMAFSFRPPEEVQFHSSDLHVLGDYAEKSLSFSAALRTINRILKKRFETSFGDSKPDSNGTFLFSRSRDSFETEDLQYNQNTMKAKYLWVRID
jgi:hypothetical protein